MNVCVVCVCAAHACGCARVYVYACMHVYACVCLCVFPSNVNAREKSIWGVSARGLVHPLEPIAEIG